MIYLNRLILYLLLSFPILCLLADDTNPLLFTDLDSPEHDYWNRPLNDPITKIKEEIESGQIRLDYGSEKAFLLSLLSALKIPPTSQTLVFSTTSLQLSLISPRNPRAVYFNEDVYLGYIPGGKIEVISIDPELGGIFYIFEIPKQPTPPLLRRSQRCMNCHANEDTHHVPGLVIKSVIPGRRGGSLESYRRHQTGHQIPLSERFGGWYVTGADTLTNHWGNVTGQFTPKGIDTTSVEVGKTFSWSKFPIETSDVLAHLLHDHQAGFINRAVEAHYLARTCRQTDGETLTSEHRDKLDQVADSLVRYLLFADEAQLPPEGVIGNSAFKRDFRANRYQTATGKSLKDFNLKSHLFQYRCSYMIYTQLFTNLPDVIKGKVNRKLKHILSSDAPISGYAYLSDAERSTIFDILQSTHPDWQD